MLNLAWRDCHLRHTLGLGKMFLDTHSSLRAQADCSILHPHFTRSDPVVGPVPQLQSFKDTLYWLTGSQWCLNPYRFTVIRKYFYLYALVYWCRWSELDRLQSFDWEFNQKTIANWNPPIEGSDSARAGKSKGRKAIGIKKRAGERNYLEK